MNIGNEQNLKGKSKVLGEGSFSPKEHYQMTALSQFCFEDFFLQAWNSQSVFSPDRKKLLTISLHVVLSFIFFM